MNTLGKTTLALAALVATVGLAPALQAQGTPAPGQQQGSGMMGQGGTMGGGNMADMMKMMENCNRMMQSMSNQTPSGTNPAPSPEQKG